MRKILIPSVGKTGGALTVRKWLKGPGERIGQSEVFVLLEGADGLVELEAGQEGILKRILIAEGKTAGVGSEIAELDGSGSASPSAQANVPEKGGAPVTANDSVVPVLMPQVGNSMEEGILVKWLVKVGDRIKKGQSIFEIETDKATVEVEATDDGRLAKIVAEAGATVAIKTPVAYLSEKDIDSAPMPEAYASIAGGSAAASPAARKLAREQGLDLGSVGSGSGPGGRILSTDLAGASRASVSASTSLPASTEIVRKKMSKMRKAIAANLQMSKQTIPHFYLRGTVDAGPMQAYYRAEKAKYPCSLNDVVTLACAKAIVEFPALRSKIDKDEIVEYPSVNIGVAVGVEDGLTVPVLLNAQAMNLQQIAANTRRIVEAARAGKLEGMGQGNFTITNLGMFGVEEFAAIVNPPEPAILAVGAVREDVIVKDGAMRAGKVMTMTLSCDHRIVDGLLAAKFMARLKEWIENPSAMGGT